MSVSGKRKQLKEGIIKILSEWLMLEYYNDYEEVAADIMALVPKPEKCHLTALCITNAVNATAYNLTRQIVIAHIARGV